MKLRPLLCELHAHTTWSDGLLSLPELVDLYGRNGFDVLAITDHVVREDDPYVAAGRRYVYERNFAAYLAEIDAEATRARARYGLLVVPGLELSFNAYGPAPLGACARDRPPPLRRRRRWDRAGACGGSLGVLGADRRAPLRGGAARPAGDGVLRSGRRRAVARRPVRAVQP